MAAAGKLQRAEMALPCDARSANPSPASTAFRVLQWNILADGLAQYGDFVRVRAYCCVLVVLVS